MYSRLTPQGRSASFAAIKIFGWISAIVTVAGTVSAVGPAVSGWWHSEPSSPAFQSPPVMATTSERQYSSPVSTTPPHREVETLHYDPEPYIAPTAEPARPVTVDAPTPVRIYVQPSTDEERHYNPILTRTPSLRREPSTPPEKMQPVHHRPPQTRPPAGSPPARSGRQYPEQRGMRLSPAR